MARWRTSMMYRPPGYTYLRRRPIRYKKHFLYESVVPNFQNELYLRGQIVMFNNFCSVVRNKPWDVRLLTFKTLKWMKISKMKSSVECNCRLVYKFNKTFSCKRCHLGRIENWPKAVQFGVTSNLQQECDFAPLPSVHNLSNLLSRKNCSLSLI